MHEVLDETESGLPEVFKMGCINLSYQKHISLDSHQAKKPLCCLYEWTAGTPGSKYVYDGNCFLTWITPTDEKYMEEKSHKSFGLQSLQEHLRYAYRYRIMDDNSKDCSMYDMMRLEV